MGQSFTSSRQTEYKEKEKGFFFYFVENKSKKNPPKTKPQTPEKNPKKYVLFLKNIV